jgi:hypothetical protein
LVFYKETTIASVESNFPSSSTNLFTTIVLYISVERNKSGGKTIIPLLESFQKGALKYRHLKSIPLTIPG